MATRGKSGPREAADEIQRRRDRIVEKAVDRAARRMDADGDEREVLEDAADAVAERVTRPFVEAADADEDGRDTAAELFLP